MARYESHVVDYFEEKGDTLPLPGAVEYKRETRRLLIDSYYRRPGDPISEYRVGFGVKGIDEVAEKIKNVVSINVVRATLPTSSDHPTRYIDVVIPEVPLIGTMHTNSQANDRVIARIPVGTLGEVAYYEPRSTQLITVDFSPVSMTHLTIKLLDSDGQPYDVTEDHSLSISIVYLRNPKKVSHPSKVITPAIPVSPTEMTFSNPVETPQTWFDENKYFVASLSIGIISTLWFVSKMRSLVSSATSYSPRLPTIGPPPM